MVALATAACSPRTPAPSPTTSANRDRDSSIEIALAGDAKTQAFSEFRGGAEIAAKQVNEEKVLGVPLKIVTVGAPDASTVGRAAGTRTLALLTAGGSGGIRSASDSIERSTFCVIELQDDLYEHGLIRSSTFQVSTPHSWQAWRLARYFGPGDRAYRKVGLIREPGDQGDAAATSLKERLGERGVAFAEAALPPAESVAAMQREAPQAVVVEGSESFLSEVFTILRESHRYEGKAGIGNGWRPQVGGFESSVAKGTGTPGGVFAADYAIPWTSGETVVAHDLLRKVVEAFGGAGKLPKLRELQAYEAVRLVAEAAKQAGISGERSITAQDRSKLITTMESFDRVRFARMPISLGPTDHVIAERDHQGLWSADRSDGAAVALAPLMRAFTSDLERTNVLEEDWNLYFEGAVPGGEAPFFHQSRFGITSAKSDDFH